jgi:SHS2 domain-containing protein
VWDLSAAVAPAAPRAIPYPQRPVADGRHAAREDGQVAGFELLEHTADIGIRAAGATLEEAFEQATLGLAEVLGAWRPGRGEPVGVAVEAGDVGGLLVDWLNEVLYLHEVRSAALGAVRLDRVGGGRAEGSVRLAPDAAPFDGVEVKAVTYHRLRVEPTAEPGAGRGGWIAEVYLDL